LNMVVYRLPLLRCHIPSKLLIRSSGGGNRPGGEPLWNMAEPPHDIHPSV
jgi:hypothetical protein